MKYPKELLRLERQAFAITKAMPDLKAAHDKFAWGSQELFEAIEGIETQFGIDAA